MKTPLALGLVLLAAGCGQKPEGDRFFPLAEGQRWQYRVTTRIDDPESTTREELTLVNRGTDVIDAAPSWRRRSADGIEYWLRSDSTGIYRIATRHPLEREPSLDKERRYVVKQPVQVGTTWESTTVAYVLARKNEVPKEVRHTHKAFPMTYRIEDVDLKVETPVGTFDGCVRVAGRAEIRLYVDAMFQWRQIPLTTLEWYCPDVGLVRLERHEPSPTKFMSGGQVTMELIAWQP